MQKATWKVLSGLMTMVNKPTGQKDKCFSASQILN